MTLERVRNEITANARAKAKQAVEQARKEAKDLIAKAEKDFQSNAERIEAETKAMKESIMTREKAAANLEAKKLSFEERRKQIDEAFDHARKAIETLPKEKRQSMMKRLLSLAEKEISIGRVYCSKADMSYVKGFQTEEASIAGGLIAESAEGTMRVDYSVETLLADFREKHIQDVMKILAK
jgi:V/A-type H+/Na+-transporting ATPase subunit E